MEKSHLDILESESIFVFREVAAQFERPLLMYSVGKDSTVLVHLARKAFYPNPIPFPLLHIDTGYKFPEMYSFRDALAKRIGAELIVSRNEEAIANGAHPSKLGTARCCGLLKTDALLNALKSYACDAAIGGARRDEEKSRAKERFFSFRNGAGHWDPKNQRPEIWSLYNGHLELGQSIRVFPLSNWTELDIWSYILREELDVVPLYFAKEREVVKTGELITLPSALDKGKDTIKLSTRFRSLGCMPCTGLIESKADTLEGIVAELSEDKRSERANRVIDYDQESSMELKKREGYF